MKEIESYECEICHEIYHKEYEAAECEFYHKRNQYANCLWRAGYNLDAINHYCGFHWPLDTYKWLPKINKDSRFIIKHLQCCEQPVYKIEEIIKNGLVRISGKPLNGEWYTTTIPILHLKEPYMEEEE